MQRIDVILFAILIAVILPAHPGTASEAAMSAQCPPVTEKPVVVFIQPAAKKIERMKKERGEDFYIFADDAMYYQSQAIEYLEKMRFPFCFSENENHQFKQDAGNTYTENQKCEGWCLILWNGKEKPVWTNATDIIMHEAYLKRAGSK